MVKNIFILDSNQNMRISHHKPQLFTNLSRCQTSVGKSPNNDCLMEILISWIMITDQNTQVVGKYNPCRQSPPIIHESDFHIFDG